MQRSANRSISVPIILSSITVLMTLALLIGWIIVIRENLTLTRTFAINRWLLAGGIASFVLVMAVLVLFSVSLVGEILESRRQQMFIDSVTHELKSPLASLKLCLETMARPGVSGSQQDQLRGMMQSDVERLTVFVDDILQASRISHRRALADLDRGGHPAAGGAGRREHPHPLSPGCRRFRTHAAWTPGNLHRSHRARNRDEERLRQRGEVFRRHAAGAGRDAAARNGPHRHHREGPRHRHPAQPAQAHLQAFPSRA